MKKLLILFILFFLITSSFSASNLIIKSINYNNLYSDSTSYITLNIENNGTQTANIINSTIIGIDNYLIYYSPTSILPNQTEQIIYEIKTGCEQGTKQFSINITYYDTTNKQLNSDEYNIEIKNPLNITKEIDTDKIIPLLTTKTKKITYKINNLGKSTITYNISITQTNNIYSEIISTKGKYSINDLNNYNFTINPYEVNTISNLLTPLESGETNSYTIEIQDINCELNKETITINYKTLSETTQLNMNIRVADPPTTPIIIFLLIITIMVSKHL